MLCFWATIPVRLTSFSTISSASAAGCKPGTHHLLLTGCRMEEKWKHLAGHRSGAILYTAPAECIGQLQFFLGLRRFQDIKHGHIIDIAIIDFLKTR